MVTIDELTGLPTTRTGTPKRDEGALGPGAGLGVRCLRIATVACPHEGCDGHWDTWHDLGSDEYVFVHRWTERTFSNTGWDGIWRSQSKRSWRKFATFHVNRTREWGGTPEGCLAYLVSHEAHPANQPTPGRARRR